MPVLGAPDAAVTLVVTKKHRNGVSGHMEVQISSSELVPVPSPINFNDYQNFFGNMEPMT